MPNIFNYFDYREYLDAFYRERKAENPGFSYRVFADKCGFRSKSYLKMVIDGTKNLSEASIQRLNRVLKLGDKALAYFTDLVLFNQASSIKVRNMYFDRLTQYNPRNAFRVLAREQYEFYSKWYHNTVRELVTMVDFGEDYERLGSMVTPPISAYRARQSVGLLLRLGLIRKTEKGYEQADTIITTGNDVPAIHGDAHSLAVHNFHLQNLALASESIETCPKHERDISCLVVALDESGLEHFKKELHAFQEKLLRFVEARSAGKTNRVYHVNFQLFPTSRETDNRAGTDT